MIATVETYGMTGAEPEIARKLVVRNLVRSLRFGWSVTPRYIRVLVVLVTVLGGVLPAVMFQLTRQLIDLVTKAQGQNVPQNQLIVAALLLALITALNNVVGSNAFNVRQMMAQCGEENVRKRIVAATASADMELVESPSWQDDAERAKSATWRMRSAQGQMTSVLESALGVVTLMGLLLVINPVLVLFALAASVVPIWVDRPIQRKFYQQWFRWTPKEREANYLEWELINRTEAKEIRAGNLGPTFTKRLNSLIDENLNKELRLYDEFNLRTTVSGLFTAAILTVAYAVVALGHASPGSLAAVFGAIAGVTGNLAQITSTAIQLETHGRAFTPLFALLDMKPRLKISAHPVELPPTSGIELSDVTFRYGNATKPAIDHVNLSIHPGEMLALVGENGAGKSTLVNLLLRFYDPSEGVVRFAGVDVRHVDIESLRNRFGVLFQNFNAYNLTARDNVILGRPGEPVDEAALESALVGAQAKELVEGLPKKLDTFLGSIFEGATDISGGQWQRLAMARVFYRNADVWILDEPTSDLDAAAEAAVFSQLRERLGGRIGIVISHRFSTVRIADRIAVMDEGRIIELGTHDELVRKGGRYAGLFELQAAGYR